MTTPKQRPFGFASTDIFPILRPSRCRSVVPAGNITTHGGRPHVKSGSLAALGVLVALTLSAGTAYAVTGHVLPDRNTATYYADRFDGRLTANSERFDQDGLTAAHKTLPFGTRVKVTNLDNDRSIVVKINDRIPRHGKSSIDLTRRAAEELGFIRKGRAPVKLRILE